MPKSIIDIDLTLIAAGIEKMVNRRSPRIDGTVNDAAMADGHDARHRKGLIFRPYADSSMPSSAAVYSTTAAAISVLIFI